LLRIRVGFRGWVALGTRVGYHVHLMRLRKYHWHLLWEYRTRMLGSVM